MAWAFGKSYVKTGATPVRVPLYRLETFAPLSGRWYRTGQPSSDLRSMRNDMNRIAESAFIAALRIVDEAGNVIAERGPEEFAGH